MNRPLPPTFQSIGALSQKILATARRENATKPLPAAVMQVGAELVPALADIFAQAEARVLHRTESIMAGMMIGLELDLDDELWCLKVLVVDRIWPGPRQEVEQLFERAIEIARAFKTSDAFRNSQRNGADDVR